MRHSIAPSGAASLDFTYSIVLVIRHVLAQQRPHDRTPANVAAAKYVSFVRYALCGMTARTAH